MLWIYYKTFGWEVTGNEIWKLHSLRAWSLGFSANKLRPYAYFVEYLKIQVYSSSIRICIPLLFQRTDLSIWAFCKFSRLKTPFNSIFMCNIKYYFNDNKMNRMKLLISTIWTYKSNNFRWFILYYDYST